MANEQLRVILIDLRFFVVPLSIAFNINLDSPIAVYVQIKNLIQFGIASGELPVDTPLPSARVLSEELDVNPNTVTKAYRDLELIGVLSTRRGVGVMVTNDAAGICGEPIRREAKGRLRDAVAECVASGHSVADISSIVDGAIEEKHLPYMVSGE